MPPGGCQFRRRLRAIVVVAATSASICVPLIASPAPPRTAVAPPPAKPEPVNLRSPSSTRGRARSSPALTRHARRRRLRRSPSPIPPGTGGHRTRSGGSPRPTRGCSTSRRNRTARTTSARERPRRASTSRGRSCGRSRPARRPTARSYSPTSTRRRRGIGGRRGAAVQHGWIRRGVTRPLRSFRWNSYILSPKKSWSGDWTVSFSAGDCLGAGRTSQHGRVVERVAAAAPHCGRASGTVGQALRQRQSCYGMGEGARS